jgi:polyisoprenoid-binding protein YceI
MRLASATDSPLEVDEVDAIERTVDEFLVAYRDRTQSRRGTQGRWAPAVLITLLLSGGLAAAAPRAIDTVNSVIIVRVYKAGIFSALGHDHKIAAPVAGGTVDAAARKVEVHVKTAALKVRDEHVSDKDRSEIQNTMLGPDVLDSEHQAEIVFRSKSAEPIGDNAWTLHGDLSLHGQSHPLAVEVRGSGGHYRGIVRFRQTEFGIRPVKIAGGAINVKDEIQIEFDIQLTG